jgi:NDP-4-keto-2,6-dideoxyhexose 3-C-methyltransferase
MIVQNKKTVCISCGSTLSDDIVIVGNQYPSAIFVPKNESSDMGIPATSLNLVRCNNRKCGLVQLSNSYDLDCVFDKYPYESGSTATMKSILQDVIKDTEKFIKLQETDVVLDIGGNDGTMLGLIDIPVKARINIDAANAIKQLVNAEDYIYVHAKFNSDVYRALNLPNPSLIYSVAMFYHLSNPLEFCKNVYDIMNDDTVWVLQMTYLGTMLQDNIFDNIVHEHAAYYSLYSLEHLIKKVGLKVVDAKIVKSYGGSIRVFIVKDTNTKFIKTDNYYKLQKFEQDNKTNTYEALYAFNSRVQLLKESIGSIFKYIVETYGKVYGFGASTKGNMILQLLDIKSDKMPYIIDNSLKKIGTLTMGSKIPIISEEEALKSLPGCLFILPYYYVDAFVSVIKKKLAKGQKLCLFIPLPHPYFITLVGGEDNAK